MKIKVELDVEPNEISLATELLAVLRSITDHVSVNGAPVPAASPSPPVSIPTSAPSPAAPSPAVPSPSPATSDMGPIFADILRSSEFAEAPEELAQELEAMAWTPVPGSTPAERIQHPAFQAFLTAWHEVALDPTILASGRSAVPFAQVLTSTNPEFKAAVRDAVIPGLLKHLAQNRPPNANRADFYLQAEVFAGLASADVVPLEGACSTAAKMLRAEERRAAAVTVLGKLVELCGYAFSSKVQPATIESLRAALASAESPEFAYDISYIRDTLGWAGPSPASTPTGSAPSASPDSAVSPLGPGSRFQPLVSLPGHSDLVFAVSHDPSRRHVMSAGKDSVVAVWGEDGAQIAVLSVGDGMFVSCLDYHRGLGRSFGLGGTAASGAAGPTAPFCLLSLAVGPAGYALDSPLKRNTQASTLRCLHETNGFVTAEASTDGRPVVQFWDAAAAPGALRPVQTFTDLEQHITAITRLQGPGTFATGSRDGHLQMWDLRQSTATGVLGHMAPSGPSSSLPRAADKIITTLDVAGPFGVACGGTDRTVRLWDVRAPGQGPLVELSLNTVVFKVAVAPGGRAAAVAGMPGVFVATGLDGSSPAALAPADPAWADGRGVQLYHDMRWNADGTVLFAAGKNKSLDMLGVVN